MDTLILESDPAVREVLATAANARGYRTVVSDNLEEGLRQLEISPFPLIIVGDRAGAMAGVDLCRKMRALPNKPPCVILLATRDDDPARLEQALAAGINDFLFLPLSPEKLRLRLAMAEQLAQTLLERSRAEQALRDMVERLELAAQGSKDGLWDGVVDPSQPWHSPHTRVWYSPRMKELLGFSDEEFPNVLMSWAELLHPDDKDRIYEALRQHLEERVPYDVEYRLRTKSGEYRWFSARGRGIWDAQGKPLRMAGSLRDVTDRKEHEEALRGEQRTLRQLLEVNERDRRLVAYEIHDGLVQYVTGALMHLEVYSLKQPLPDARGRREFDLAMRLLRDSVDEARRLISGLRPPILDESGIVPAIEYLVHDGRGAGEPKIEFVHKVEFDRVAPALESAIFRIVQEGLTNVRRHSKSTRARVELTQTNGTIRIEVQDWGVGFDPTRVRDSQYGLRGISERVRLLEGATTIESAPGKGTRILVKLPLLPENAGETPPEGREI